MWTEWDENGEVLREGTYDDGELIDGEPIGDMIHSPEHSALVNPVIPVIPDIPQ
jgi:hypothetical protein